MCFQQEGGRWGRKRQMVKGRSTHSKNNCYSFSLSLFHFLKVVRFPSYIFCLVILRNAGNYKDVW